MHGNVTVLFSPRWTDQLMDVSIGVALCTDTIAYSELDDLCQPRFACLCSLIRGTCKIAFVLILLVSGFGSWMSKVRFNGRWKFGMNVLLQSWNVIEQADSYLSMHMYVSQGPLIRMEHSVEVRKCSRGFQTLWTPCRSLHVLDLVSCRAIAHWSYCTGAPTNPIIIMLLSTWTFVDVLGADCSSAIR